MNIMIKKIKTFKKLLIVFFIISLFFIFTNNTNDIDSKTQATNSIPDELKGNKKETDNLNEEKKDDKKPENKEIIKESKEEKEEKKEEKIEKEPDYDAVSSATDQIPENDLDYIIKKINVKKEKDDKAKKEELAKKEEEKKKLLEQQKKDQEKKDEKKVEDKKTEDKKYTELNTDQTDDFKKFDNKDKKSTMIIFQDENSNIPPSLNYDFDEIPMTNIYPWYKSKDFIPENVKEFYMAQPDFKYIDNIIQNGNIGISAKLGEEVFALAYNYLINNDIKNAINSFVRLIYYNYRKAEASYYLGWCYNINKDYFTSINYMKNAVKEGEKSDFDKEVIADYMYQTGAFYLNLGDYDNSIKYFKESLIKDPELIKNYEKLGLAYYKLGEYIKALETWKTGMENNNLNCSKNYYWLLEKMK